MKIRTHDDFPARQKIWITGTDTGIGFALYKDLTHINYEQYAKDAVYGMEKEDVDLSAIENQRDLSRRMEKYDTPDILVLNAGIMHNQWSEFFTVQKWDEIMNVNLRSNFLFTQWFLNRHIKKNANKPRRVVYVISMAAKYALRCSVAYCCSKAALAMMCKCMAKEVSGRIPNLYFYGLSPGGIKDTRMVKDAKQFLIHGRGMTEEEAVEYQVQSPLKRYCTQQEVVDALKWLMFDAPKYMTGTNIEFTGGFPV